MRKANSCFAGPARWALYLPVWIAGCATSAPVVHPTPPKAKVVAPAPVAAPAAPSGLYAVDEALRDVLSGELEFIGRGRWPGIERSRACAFRNDRVVVVLAYCTITEVQAFRIDVYAPDRGRMRVYAEARGPVSTLKRDDYFTFLVESEPPPDAATGIAPITRTMSFPQLHQYEQQRYDARLPECYGGELIEAPVGRCFDQLVDRYAPWTTRNGAFLEHASEDWYRVIRQMRTLAARHGVDPD